MRRDSPTGLEMPAVRQPTVEELSELLSAYRSAVADALVHLRPTNAVGQKVMSRLQALQVRFPTMTEIPKP